MFILNDKAKTAEAEIEEIPGDDASVAEVMKYNCKRLYREYLGTESKRKVAIDVICFATACFAMKNYGDMLSV